MGRLWAVAAIVAVQLAALAGASAAQAAESLALQLSGPPRFEFAGYYAALWQGFYRDAGLDVMIKPGGGQAEQAIDPVREVTVGRAEFGVGGAELVVRAAQGLPLSLLAPIFQRSGAMIYYRGEQNFASPGALAKAAIGRLPTGNSLQLEAVTALKAEGLDPEKLDTQSIMPGQSIAALAEKKVDAAPGSAWEAPYLAGERGLALKALDPAQYRVEFYGDTLFTLRRLVESEPQTVRAFRAASLKGWEYALQHPDAVAKRMLAELPHPPGIKDAAGFARYQEGVAQRLARWPEIALGHSNPERWARIEKSMAEAGALLQTAGSDQFVYDPEAAMRRGTDLRDGAILGATLVVALAAFAWLWRGRRRRVPASSAAAAGGAEVSAVAAVPAPLPAAATREPLLPEADLNELVAPLERSLRQRVPRQIAFRLSLLPQLWRCHADPQMVRRLLFDLVAAAAAGLKNGGELIVGTRNIAFDDASAQETPGAEAGEWARITVRDNGAGLSDEALARIFDPLDTVSPAVAGAAAAMRGSGGFARVESAEGVGTAIHLYFPRLAAASKTARAAE